MKKKLLMILFSTLSMASITCLVCLNAKNTESDNAFFYKHNSALTSINNNNIGYQAIVNSDNLINTTIENASLVDSAICSKYNDYIAWSNDEDSPIRGISSISLSYLGDYQTGSFYFYFSYNYLTLDNILSGKYVDLEFVQLNPTSDISNILTFDVNKLDHRYFLMIHFVAYEPLYFDGLSIETPCDEEPSAKSIGEITEYKSDLQEALPSHVPFIGNGSYIEIESTETESARAIKCVQSGSVYSTFVNSLINQGYIHSFNDANKHYYQKQITNDSYYTVILEDNTPESTSYLEIKTIVFAGEMQWLGAEYASGCFSYADNVDERIEIMGKLEKNAMENFLTGIPLFENSKYVSFSSRVSLATENYISGYGWGLLEECELNGVLPSVSEYKNYLQLALENNPYSLNLWNSYSEIDLYKYISSPLWGKRIDGEGYKLYPVLAKDTVNGEPFNLPIHVGSDNESNLYNTWKVYVKVGSEEGVTYRTASSKMSSYNNRYIKLEDYEFVYQMLLTESACLVKGAELAGDVLFGIKGASDFYRRSKNITDNDALDNLWNNMKNNGELGIKTGVDENGSFIQFEFINAIDEFYALNTLSKNIYSPVPKEFVKALGDGDYVSGSQKYGLSSYNTSIIDSTLCVGPYLLERWDDYSRIVLSLNDEWYEVGNSNRYKIPGVVFNVYSQSAQDPTYIWNLFKQGKLDYAVVPSSVIKTGSLENYYREAGNSVFRLNVNSCTQERWDELFWSSKYPDVQKPASRYSVKPWMSNKNFLKGLFWSIDREGFASQRGVTPSINYFSDNYLCDPLLGRSYNSTQAHREAIQSIVGDNQYGYDLHKAELYFKNAVEELLKDGLISKGTKDSPFNISINIWWMYPSDIQEYGNAIAKYFEDAFNSEFVSNGTIKLRVNQSAVNQWDKIYTDHIQCGSFDLAYGSLTGDENNPLLFMETIKSNNSSGFTLNWGADTSIVDPYNPIEFDGKLWSFDALWKTGFGYSLVKNSVTIEPVKNNYISTVSTDSLFNGDSLSIAFEFANINQKIKFEIDSVNIYIQNYGVVSMDVEDVEIIDGIINVNISPGLGYEINNLIVDSCNLYEQADKTSDPKQRYAILHPFTMSNYNKYWYFEVAYSVSMDDKILFKNNSYIFRNSEDYESNFNY